MGGSILHGDGQIYCALKLSSASYFEPYNYLSIRGRRILSVNLRLVEYPLEWIARTRNIPNMRPIVFPLVNHKPQRASVTA